MNTARLTASEKLPNRAKGPDQISRPLRPPRGQRVGPILGPGPIEHPRKPEAVRVVSKGLGTWRNTFPTSMSTSVPGSPRSQPRTMGLPTSSTRPVRWTRVPPGWSSWAWPWRAIPGVRCRAKPNQERLQAGQIWENGDWVFATPTGAPLNPRTDWGMWKRLLKDAGIRDGRLHDARHTAAAVLLLLGVREQTMMGLMGWSNPAMAQRYAHMADPIRRDIATRVGGLLWGDEAGASAK